MDAKSNGKGRPKEKNKDPPHKTRIIVDKRDEELPPPLDERPRGQQLMEQK